MLAEVAHHWLGEVDSKEEVKKLHRKIRRWLSRLVARRLIAVIARYQHFFASLHRASCNYITTTSIMRILKHQCDQDSADQQDLTLPQYTWPIHTDSISTMRQI
jgi:hypothetical protein